MKLRNKAIIPLLSVMIALMMVITACGSSDSNNDENNNQNTNGTTNTEPSENTEPDADADAGDGNQNIVEKPFEEGAELTVWEGSGVHEQWMKFVAEAFTEEHGIPVKVQVVENGEAPAKLQTDGPAGLAADVFVAPHDHIGNMTAAGLILPNDHYTDADRSRFLENAITSLSMEGELYGYPSAIETYILYYNKNLVPNPPKSFDELIEQAEGINDFDNDQYGLLWEMGNLYYDSAFIYGFGGYVFGSDGTDPNDIGLNNEGAIAALDYIKEIQEKLIPFKKEDITYDIKESFFKDGQLGFNINGPWAAPSFNEAGVDYGVMPLPELPNGEHPKSFSGIRALFVNSYTDYPMASKLFAAFATSEEMLAKRYEITQSLAPDKALMEDPAVLADPVSIAVLEQAAHSIPMPSIPEMPAVWGPVGAAITDVWNNGTDSKKALDQAVQQIEEAMAATK